LAAVWHREKIQRQGSRLNETKQNNDDDVNVRTSSSLFVDIACAHALARLVFFFFVYFFFLGGGVEGGAFSLFISFSVVLNKFCV
jgi:hypothetical protein